MAIDQNRAPIRDDKVVHSASRLIVRLSKNRVELNSYNTRKRIFLLRSNPAFVRIENLEVNAVKDGIIECVPDVPLWLRQVEPESHSTMRMQLHQNRSDVPVTEFD